jgi:glycosyltransferase involved in cell wall biosynthesis
MRILIVGDSPALPSGRAETTRLIFEGLLRRFPGEYDLKQIGLSHCLAVTASQWPVFPTKTLTRPDGSVDFSPDDLEGERTLHETVDKLKPDIVFASNDPHRLTRLVSALRGRPYRLILYLKVDGFPIHEGVGPALERADLVVTMSEFSSEHVLSRFPGIEHKLRWLYSPADTTRFAPVSETDKAELRADLLPEWMPQNAFILGWVGLARWRKQTWLPYKIIHYLRTGKYLNCSDCRRVSLFDWDPVDHRHLDEVGTVLESRPGYHYDVCVHCGSKNVRPAEPMEDVFLWMHTPLDDPFADWPPQRLERDYAAQRGRDVHYTEGYGVKAGLAPADMPLLYQLWDAVLQLSGAEGFGLPAWEAMCSGLPVIYSDYSTPAEYLGAANAGLPVGGFLQPEARTEFWRMIADVRSAIEAVRALYLDRKLGRTLGANGRAFVDRFRAEIQVEIWHEIFQSIRGKRQDRSLSSPRVHEHNA